MATALKKDDRIMAKAPFDPILAMRLEFEASGVPVSRVVEITPEMAAALLERNVSNRPKKEGNIEKMGADMLEGRWQLNGETIIISNDGMLNDGQNRLMAAAKFGAKFTTLVIYGVERESRMTVDIGVARTVGDMLGMDNIQNYNISAAITGKLLRWENKTESSKGNAGESKTAIYEYYFKHREEIDAAIETLPVKDNSLRSLGGPSLIAFTWVILSRKAGQESATDFWRQIISGANLEEGSPLLYVRNRFMRDASMPPAHKQELIFRAWNAWRESRSVKTLPIIGQLPELV